MRATEYVWKQHDAQLIISPQKKETEKNGNGYPRRHPGTEIIISGVVSILMRTHLYFH